MEKNIIKPLIVLALLIIGLLGGYAIGEKSTDHGATWQTYRNEAYGFEIKYPTSMILYERPRDIQMMARVSKNFSICDPNINIACIVIPHERYPDTSLGATVLAFQALGKECEPHSGEPEYLQEVTANGVEFIRYRVGEAVIGYRYYTKKTLPAGCLAIKVVHDTARPIGDGISEQEYTEPLSVLNDVFFTFRLTK